MTEREELPSSAELRAREAEALPAFGQLNLLHVRRQVSQFLSLIGREGIFDQYTTHDISHIDKMLESLEWIIPPSTRDAMSAADWLMIVLAIYFHDMGMLVTAREYDARSGSEFPRFRDDVLLGGTGGKDYQAKVAALGPDKAERFLYQEYVRHKHAERIRSWVMGDSRRDLGVATETVAEIDALLKPLGLQFRRDLGMICESHHLDDLGDLRKYKVSQPYGDSDAATANLQYCAVVLRTADLLHITSDRTPSVTFRVINPTDPISQQEWAKQQAVTRLRPKVGLDADGNPSETVPKDTIEVFAFFKNEDGFFGLTSYLSYAADQLKKSNEWIAQTRKHNLAHHEFPWRRIDDTNIETVGFIRDTFEFTIDQSKILDLLTGHTLYNDTRVVLRELVQNAIDAIRLQHHPAIPGASGHVRIRWDSRKRILSVSDDGTGMSQSIISNFLLKVGTSRYQDPDFKKAYPDFSSISRFGIGVLSTFMIADSVDIFTCHPDDDSARQLTLRSVHGKYLIRTITKSDATIQSLYPHGTEFRLTVRPSVSMPDVLETAKLWIVVPQCAVTVQIDDGAATKIGHASVSQALVSILADIGIAAEIGTDSKAPPEAALSRQIRVRERSSEGVTVAYAVEWSKYFRQWAFFSAKRSRMADSRRPTLGTCLEGVRVESDAPGFEGMPLVALANVSGPGAPKTNVARTGLEATPERDRMLKNVYGIYRDHVAVEIEELHRNRSFSLTWALGEARYILADLVDDENESEDTRPISPALFEDALQELAVLPIETIGSRRAVSSKTLRSQEQFWTIDCGLFDSAEPLIREASTTASLSGIIAALGLTSFSFPDGLVLCGIKPYHLFGAHAYSNREVDRIVIQRDQRRIDLRWVNKAAQPRWASIRDMVKALGPPYESVASVRRFKESRVLRIAIHDVVVEPALEEMAVQAFDTLFVMAATPVAAYLSPWISKVSLDPSMEIVVGAVFVDMVIGLCFESGGRIPDPEGFLKRVIRSSEIERAGNVEAVVDLSELTALVGTTDWRAFSPSAWRRRD